MNGIYERRKYLGSLFKNGIAFLSVTRGGSKIISKISEKIDFTHTTIFIPEKFKDEVGCTKVQPVYFRSVKEVIKEIFSRYDAIVSVISLGALVRLISPYLKSKEEDPAVLCIDEVGRFVISVLSGHVGGANELAREVANILNATPVITTASDSLGTIPVDIFGREYGWKAEADHDTFVKVSSAVVNGEPVAIIQESGERFLSLPDNVKEVSIHSDYELPEKLKGFSACLFITHRLVDRDFIFIPCVFYRPPVLHVGIGFDSGATREDFYNFIREVFDKFSISLLAVRRISTVDLKKGDTEFERFIEEFKERIGADVEFFSKDELKKVSDRVMNPSHFAEKYLGVASVSEACALLSAGQNSKIIVEKQKYRGKSGAGITLAVAIEE